MSLGNTKQNTKFMVLYTNFKIHGKFKILAKFMILETNFLCRNNKKSYITAIPRRGSESKKNGQKNKFSETFDEYRGILVIENKGVSRSI